MKQLFLFICTLFALQANAQVKLENIVKPGTKLIYAVEAGGKKYDFIVTVKDLKGSSFDWEMTDPVNISGTIIHTPKALANANTMYNFFQPGTKKLDDKTLSVWLSKKVYEHLSKTAGKPIKIYVYGPGKDPLDMGTFTGSVPLEVIIDGKTENISTELVKPLVLSGRDYVPDDKDEFFSFYDSPSFPIILRLNLDFSISLKEIKTK